MNFSKLITLLLLSINVMAADFTIEVNPSNNSIDDSKVSSLSISKITNLQSSLDAKANSSSLGSLASKSVVSNADISDNSISIDKILNWILAIENRKVFAHYAMNRVSPASYQTIPAGAETKLNFEYQIEDSHNAVSIGANWKFIAPYDGVYIISSMIIYNSGPSWVVPNEAFVTVWKNDSLLARIGGLITTAPHSSYMEVVTAAFPVKMNQNDYIDLRTYQNAAATTTIIGSAAIAWVTIHKQ